MRCWKGGIATCGVTIGMHSHQLALGREASDPVPSLQNVIRSANWRPGAAVSLFSGAGGLDIGLERADFETRAAVEVEEVARQSLIANIETWFPALEEGAIFEDIVSLDFDQLLDAAGLAPGDAAIVHGGPPCTPFSKSGYWLAYKRAGEDPKASLLDNYVEALEAIQPKCFLMENVYGLAYSNHNRPILERFLHQIEAAGYAHDKRVLLAADFGAPQLRQRFFVAGVRRDLLDCSPDLWQMPWPDASHDGPHERRVDRDHSLDPHVTASEAFVGLDARDNPTEDGEDISGTYEGALREVPPGDNYLYLTEKRGHPNPQFEWRSRYWSFLLKLHPDRPSPTIQGQPGPWVGPFHWDNRRLRVAELKRLMTFPDEFEICGNRRQQQLQLGNAVPPQLAARIGVQLAAELARLGAGQLAAAA